ncbi:M23 family metallopeptidase [Algoriphagus sp. D3-2-R+10]|uniref:M23 family metallopeptidase n=1 Tax=Algoriphagus aurantiacus TaxID=3103948 RepID=UPI002B3C664D|nr:M23 family metallopeptidase [Algoriphagus sp. D3-2-R+10]MEB2774587.1 M23 family metallopeptidase [Algoriphagus sp. D3-2-R+10]
MKRILSVILFLFVAHQAFSQFYSMEFQKKLPEVNVIGQVPNQPNTGKSELKFISELIQPAIKERGVVLASAPLDDFSMTSNFGFRTDPISNEHKFHRGIDLITSRSKVYSMLHGKVVSVGYDSLLGNFIKVQHGKYESLYGHLSLIFVSAKENVLPGSVLGISGSTGRTTGDHLHLTIKKGEEYINPSLFIRMISKISTKEELITYLSTL